MRGRLDVVERERQGQEAILCLSSDNGDPITGLFIVLAVSHGLVTILETLKKCFMDVE